jgi:hypothetical protein
MGIHRYPYSLRLRSICHILQRTVLNVDGMFHYFLGTSPRVLWRQTGLSGYSRPVLAPRPAVCYITLHTMLRSWWTFHLKEVLITYENTDQLQHDTSDVQIKKKFLAVSLQLRVVWYFSLEAGFVNQFFIQCVTPVPTYFPPPPEGGVGLVPKRGCLLTLCSV